MLPGVLADVPTAATHGRHAPPAASSAPGLVMSRGRDALELLDAAALRLHVLYSSTRLKSVLTTHDAGDHGGLSKKDFKRILDHPRRSRAAAQHSKHLFELNLPEGNRRSRQPRRPFVARLLADVATRFASRQTQRVRIDRAARSVTRAHGSPASHFPFAFRSVALLRSPRARRFAAAHGDGRAQSILRRAACVTAPCQRRTRPRRVRLHLVVERSMPSPRASRNAPARGRHRGSTRWPCAHRPKPSRRPPPRRPPCAGQAPRGAAKHRAEPGGRPPPSPARCAQWPWLSAERPRRRWGASAGVPGLDRRRSRPSLNR